MLECQECQEAYHPLCHQPPVIDVDVYDPRFVWRCRRCVETPSVTPTKVKIIEKGPMGKIRRNSDTVKENATISELRMPEQRDSDFLGKNSKIYGNGKNGKNGKMSTNIDLKFFSGSLNHAAFLIMSSCNIHIFLKFEYVIQKIVCSR